MEAFAELWRLSGGQKPGAKLMDRDRHAGPDGAYRIRSIYFDNYRDQALAEKLQGVRDREKFRIRFYDLNPNMIKLEKKAKRNRLYYKSAARLSLEECERLLAGDGAFLLARGEPLLAEMYAKIKGNLLRPRTVVDYLREPYVYTPGNVRVTFDSDIRSGLFSRDVFDRRCRCCRRRTAAAWLWRSSTTHICRR